MTLNHTILLNLALRIFQVFVRIFLIAYLYLNQTFLDYMKQTWMIKLILVIYHFFNPKGFRYSFHHLAFYVKKRAFFCTGLSLENSGDSYLRFVLVLLYSVSYLFSSIYHFIFVHSFWCYFIYHRWSSLNQPIY